jgi:hypothetical protein
LPCNQFADFSSALRREIGFGVFGDRPRPASKRPLQHFDLRGPRITLRRIDGESTVSAVANSDAGLALLRSAPWFASANPHDRLFHLPIL